MRSETAQRGTWVVLGGIHLRHPSTHRRPEEPLVLLRVPPQEVCVPSTTVVVRWDTLGICPARAVTASGRPLASGRIEGRDLFTDALPGPALTALAGTPTPSDLAPLFYLAEHPGGGYHAYAQIQFHPDDACFVRITTAPVGRGAAQELHWLEAALTAFGRSALPLNNHHRCFRTHFAGTELEYKYNLTPGTDIWTSALELLKALRRGDLVGCRPEYRNEFQTYATENHLFDVTGPDTERGYASFIPTVTAGYVLKRKWYIQDSFARRERLIPDVRVAPDSFGDYLRSELGLQVTAMPPFRRVRYDVQCESMRTGHVYGIFFDHCALLTQPEVALSQCEMEYRRTRSLLEHDETEVLGEMERIGQSLLDQLTAHGLTQERTFYSKLSFLRNAVAARPELSPEH
ncbi:hypothetical protein ACIQVO_39945 [Streptomyces sp. NPDC101062]|uniref:hypothetical protein n=1 Tax=unclassified Streptomyces TaxID=2593676 RepID=UPI00382C4FC6